MHYIIGANFSIKLDPKRGFRSRENQFTANTLYKLINIAVQANNLIYTFIGTDGTRVDSPFESSKDADAFIAKMRNEQLPNYSADLGKIDI